MLYVYSTISVFKAHITKKHAVMNGKNMAYFPSAVQYGRGGGENEGESNSNINKYMDPYLEG